MKRKLIISNSQNTLSEDESTKSSNAAEESNYEEIVKKARIEDVSGLHINQLPPEIMLKIFSELGPMELRVNVAPVCQSWRDLALDFSLWKEEVAIKGMGYSTEQLICMIRSKAPLSKISITDRNDLNIIIPEIFENLASHLESLTLNNCTGVFNRKNIKSKIMVTLLKKCSGLKSLNIEDTSFRSRDFYRILSKKIISQQIKNLKMTIIRPTTMERILSFDCKMINDGVNGGLGGIFWKYF